MPKSIHDCQEALKSWDESKDDLNSPDMTPGPHGQRTAQPDSCECLLHRGSPRAGSRNHDHETGQVRPEQAPGCQRHGSDRVKSSSSGGCPFALGISLLKPDGSNIAIARRWMTIVTSARPIADMIAPTPMNRVAPITGFRMVFNLGQFQWAIEEYDEAVRFNPKICRRLLQPGPRPR